jgi:predicted ATPase/DNA-binding SARP family transcriptional activator/Tfp pilus assembly protein PilF
MATDLQVRLFGPLTVRVEGAPLPPLRTRKVAWLFALLVLNHERPVERTWLAATLWPDSDHRESLKNLRNSLHDLRHALGSQETRIQSPTPGTLQLDLEGTDVDLLEFDASIKRGDPLSLREAVALYDGSLLEGCDEEWVLLERQQRQQAYLQALETLAENEFKAGTAAQSVQYLRICIGVDPFQETAQCALMNALAATGDYAGATQTYRAFRLLLHEHLQTQPAAETTALYQQIRVRARQMAGGIPVAIFPATLPGKLADPPTDATPEETDDYPVGPVVRHNLPSPLTSFIGREQESAEVKAWLEKTRLLTLTGAGGSGKTRLSLAVAEELLGTYPDGVWLVELASLSDPALVVQTVASVLEIREQSGVPPLQALVAALRSRTLLLVLDNCEHLVASCGELAAALLRGCPTLRLLATSREHLGIAGEQTYRVPSLSLPDLQASLTVEYTSRYEAVRLFLERAWLAGSDFQLSHQNAPTVASVCHRLDGIPLAIEMAAARVGVLSVEEINARLDDRFRLLTGGDRSALPRQQTLRALIDWSYDLLSEAEKRLLCRLSVFAGGWTLAAVEAICADFGFEILDFGLQPTSSPGRSAADADSIANPKSQIQKEEVLDLLSSLVNKSLVIAQTQGETTRYYMLETVRQYARDRLSEVGESTAMRARHRDRFLALAEEVESKLHGSEQAHWLGVMEEEYNNLRQALTFCLESPEEGEAGLRLGATLARFWRVHGHLSEGRQWLTAVLSHPGAQGTSKARADALHGAGTLAYMQGDYVAAHSQYEESLAIRRELGDRKGIAGSVNNLGLIAKEQGDYALARSRYEESLAIQRELGERSGIANSLTNLGNVAKEQGDYVSARSLHEESLAIQGELGNRLGIAASLGNLGNVACSQGDYALARALHEESLSIDRELGDQQGIATSLHNLGNVAKEQGDYVSARSLYEESLEMRRELRDRRGIAGSLHNLGNIAYEAGDYALARSLHEESLAMRRELGDRRGIASSLEAFASLAVREDQAERSAQLWGAAEALRETIGSTLPPREREQQAHEAEAVRKTLGEATYTAAWEEGHALTLMEAIALAAEFVSTTLQYLDRSIG